MNRKDRLECYDLLKLRIIKKSYILTTYFCRREPEHPFQKTLLSIKEILYNILIQEDERVSDDDYFPQLENLVLMYKLPSHTPKALLESVWKLTMISLYETIGVLIVNRYHMNTIYDFCYFLREVALNDASLSALSDSITLLYEEKKFSSELRIELLTFINNFEFGSKMHYLIENDIDSAEVSIFRAFGLLFYLDLAEEYSTLYFHLYSQIT